MLDSQAPLHHLILGKDFSAPGETDTTHPTCPNRGAQQGKIRSKTEMWVNSRSSLPTPCKNVKTSDAHLFLQWACPAAESGVGL